MVYSKKICSPVLAVVIKILLKKYFCDKNFLCGRTVYLSYEGNQSDASSASDALIQRCSFVKYGTSTKRHSFRIAALNIFRKFLAKIAATELMFSMVMSFQYELCCRQFFRNFPKFQNSFFKESDTSNFVLLFLSNFQNTF